MPVLHLTTCFLAVAYGYRNFVWEIVVALLADMWVSTLAIRGLSLHVCMLLCELLILTSGESLVKGYLYLTTLSNCISGHYVVICGYDMDANEFEIRDPGTYRFYTFSLLVGIQRKFLLLPSYRQH